MLLRVPPENVFDPSICRMKERKARLQCLASAMTKSVYVNDLPQASNLTPTLFADDTFLTIACANSANLQNGVNDELQKS